MQIQLKAAKVWLATEPVDFRKAINGLSELVSTHYNHRLDKSIYVFHNRAKNKLKLLAYHRNGAMLIYKQLDKKRFTLTDNGSGLVELNELQLSWLLAGLDWVDMSAFETLTYDDYF